MNTPKISVIIPLYNAERFIRQCLISVLASKFTDYEVLVVDDCSTDNSVAEVMKLLPHFDGRLKLLHTETNSGGAGVPRNLGIRHAAGKYVAFVDADDFLLPNALGELFDAAETFQADVVHTEKFFSFEDAGKSTFTRAELTLQRHEAGAPVDIPTLEPDDLRERIQRCVDGKFLWLPWGKLFHRDLIVDNRIVFPQMKTSDDFVFCFECLCCAKNYLRVPFVTNVYRLLPNSTSRRVMSSRAGVKFWLGVVTQGAALIDEFTRGLEFFRRNPAVRRDALEFFIDKHFGMIKNLFQGVPAYDVQKIFYDELQNPALDSHGKNLVAAYLYAERALTR